ncbi:MAG: substrate-binding domain-containing protein [Bacteroidales bacterium]
MQKRVSLKDIAAKVGVSVALVSYVMNGQEKEKRVGREVVEKIRKAAEELNYQPNQIARSLRMKSTKTIGLIVADIANPFFGQLARIIENEAANLGYTVIFGSSDEDKSKSEALVNSLLNRQVDGFIIVPAEGSDGQIKNLMKRKIPLVLVDRYFPDINTNHVVLNNFQATYDATIHLIENGIQNITMIAYKSELIHMKERIRGYLDAMKTSGLTENLVVEEIRYEAYKEDMEKAFERILKIPWVPKGIIFATNALSVSGLYSMRAKCLKIPEDIAFIGFDGGESFDLFNPPLSFVQQPLEDMGKEAFSLLLGLINGSAKTTQVMLNPSLVIRNSGGC